MKRVELIRRLEQMGCARVRQGGRLGWYQNAETGACQPVPRHSEIAEGLARSILKKLGS